MRAYTSLFGHIMGSNPEICGYYEMHIGYYSWRSFIRQKLLYFDKEDIKPSFDYMFDKVLHNEHKISFSVLNDRRTKVIFCLRHPRDVVPSILELYQRVDAAHEFNSETFATEYYIQRMAQLELMAASLQQDFFYLDAQALKSDTDETLRVLSDWLQLKTRLTSNYEMQRNTSRKRFGDSSEKLRAGRILNDSSDYQEFMLNEVLQNNAAHAYETARAKLVQSSAIRCLSQSILSSGNSCSTPKL